MRMHRFIRPLLLASLLLALSAASFAGVFVSVSVAPPPLPVYEQPMCPGAGYIWTPGYWGWGDDGYYWVPGTWVMAPQPGFLWTPGYWGWSGGAYIFNAGYWGPHVGFYGGVNYGFGYGGRGYDGGYWRGNNFYYNRSVNRVNVTNITNVYNKTVIVNNHSRVAYNGPGGVQARPNSREQQFAHERHVEPTRDQIQHRDSAARDPQLFARNNHGRPAVAATARPGDFKGGAVPARAAGGRIAPATLNANAKNMPAPRNGGGNAPARANNDASASGHNGPKPSRGGNATHNNASAPSNANARNVPRPPNAGTSERGGNARGGNGPRESAAPTRTANTPHEAATPHNQPHESRAPRAAEPPSRGNPPAQHYNAPAQHANAPAPHASAPQQHSAPQQQQHSAPSHGAEQGHGNEKPHR